MQKHGLTTILNKKSEPQNLQTRKIFIKAKIPNEKTCRNLNFQSFFGLFLKWFLKKKKTKKKQSLLRNKNSLSRIKNKNWN